VSQNRSGHNGGQRRKSNPDHPARIEWHVNVIHDMTYAGLLKHKLLIQF